MRVLPKGATALDYAFDIHSELGARCIGAKVNHRLCSLSHELQSGDQVEIITSKRQKPSDDWLNFVITGKAKSRIKYYLKEEKRKIAEDGKEIVQRKLSHLGANMNAHNTQELMNFYKKNSAVDLFYSYAVGALDVKDLKTFTVTGDKLAAPVPAAKPELTPEQEDAKPQKGGKVPELIIFGESSDKILYKIAQCCQAIPGDDVFGFVTTGEGLKIHRTDCPNAPQLLANFGHRIVKTKWAKNKEISFLSAVRITGLDNFGVVQAITGVLSGNLQLNMRSLSIESKDGIFEGIIKVFVHDRDELDELCKNLASLDDISKVERLDGVEE